VEDSVRLPLLHHIARVPQGGEPRGQWFRWLDFWEGRSFRHLPSNKGNEDQQLAEVKLVALFLCFMKILLQLVDEVARLVHLHPFNSLSYEVNDEPHDLRWSILPDELACYLLTS
jgi:hypothetical protein